MTNPNIQLLCQYNPENDQLQIVKSQNFNSIDSINQYTITDAVGDIIGSMNTTLTEAIKNTGGSKLFAEGRAFIIEVGYDYALNLQEARIKYGEQGYRDELTAIGKSMVSFGAGFVGSEIGAKIGFAYRSTLPGKIAGAISGGIISSGLYENYLEQPLENLINKVFDINFEENTLTSKTIFENNHQSTSITTIKSINPSNTKPSVAISSNNYTKEQLIESSKSLIQNDGKNLIGSNIKIQGSDGTINASLLDNSLLSQTEKFLAKNIKLDAPILTKIDNNQNPLYLIKNNDSLTLADNTSTTLETIINTISSTQVATDTFMNHYMHQLTSIFTTGSGLAGLISDVNAGIQRGDTPEQIAKTIALKALVQSAGQQIKNAFLLSDADQQLFNANPSLAIAVDKTTNLAANESGVMSQEGQDALNNFATNHPVYNATYLMAVSMATTIILNANEGWDSKEYEVATAQITAQVAAQIAINEAVKAGWFGAGLSASAAGAGVGASIAHIISAGINDLFAKDHMNSHQWQSTFVSAGVVGVAAYAGFSAAAYLIGGSIAGPIGAVVAGIIVSKFLGGKVYKEGQYPDPYSYLKIEAKADGTGNKIIGIEPEGVVAIAREYYHDDIYGHKGSDNLIGKSGTNTIYGYEGNDHIEGRGDIDLIIAGQGDDEIFAGNGDDQIYGSEGNDNLFGGNGNDIIIGGTGASISVKGSLEDGADFIQGGNGDDQIMGEAGDDVIEGNSGNDTILGGIGNDRIQGDQLNLNQASINQALGITFDDSILGEDGDDMILGQLGNDIIDGGAGVDYIEGNEGNDNIRGGDGNDEISGNSGVDIIYGDAGNDLINTGSQNDLAFGGLGNDIIYGGDSDDTLSGEFGNDYLIGSEGNDTIDGGAGDDVIFAGINNDIITTGEGNDTIIYRIGDGDDIINDLSPSSSNLQGQNDILRLSEINSKLSNNISDKLILTKFATYLIVQFKDDSGSIIADDKITITNQFGGDKINGTGSEILKKIEFADGKVIDLTSITINANNSISYTTSTYSNIDTSIQEELALGYNDMMQVQDEQANPSSTFNANNYSSSGEQEEIDNEKYNEVQWLSMKKKRNIFGGHYTVWYKYYEQNLSGTNGNDRIVGHWWSENIYGGNGDDQLHGGEGDDNLFGGEGSDILHGGAGVDNIYGQTGEDLIYGGSGNDYLNGGVDNDKIYANQGNDHVIGDAGDDYLEGNGGADRIEDDQGNNIIIAGLGTDLINTGAGNDKIEGNDDADTINAGDGNNLIYGNGGNDTITAGSGNDSIYGQEGFDLINAGAGDDYIAGGANDDVINGQDGADTIYGDTGIDQISGGIGDDYIYGGSGADILKGENGNDQIKGGDADDWIEGGENNDSLYGQSGSDKIYGDAGNDIIDGGIEGDVLEGGDGDDSIIGGVGNDILIDGAGSDILDGGNDLDIIILTTEIDENQQTKNSTSIDTVKNFNKNEDKIILKTSYKTPISFVDIQSNISQVNNNVEITLNNGQKIIIENINISDITSSNFQIGLSGGKNNDILFGTDGEDIIFGEDGNDKIYGGDGNDELWGGKGSDELYGEAGNDILRYEADGKYQEIKKEVFFDEKVWVDGYSFNYVHRKHYFIDSRLYDFTPNIGDEFKYEENIRSNKDIFVEKSVILARNEEFKKYSIEFSNSKVFNSIDWNYVLSHGLPWDITTPRNIIVTWGWNIIKIEKIDYIYDLNSRFSTKNFHNNSLTDITGYNRTFDKFIGGSGINTILMTEGNDVIALDDPTSASGLEEAGTSTSARMQDISVIHAGAGDDVINFTTQKYSYGDIVIYGGIGNDKLWLSSGNDQIFGGEGNDEIYSGAGDDQLNGGSGDDILYAGDGNDNLEGGTGLNQLFGEDGDDVFIAGIGADSIDGGNGSDTISYVNSTSAVIVNLATNSFSFQQAQNDAINDNISSIENITGSAFNDILTGNSTANSLNGGSGDDILNGEIGSDLYVYSSNSGIDIITETGTDSDILRFTGGVIASDLTFAINGNDLEIQVGASSQNKVIIKDQVINNYIETIKINPVFNISKKFFITTEDQALNFDNPLDQTNSNRRNFESLTAIYGSLIFDEVANQFKYQANSNFHGIDEIEIIEEDGTKNKFTIFVNGINDAPTFTPLGEIPNKEVKVEEEWSVNLKDYFTDVDGDNLKISLKLQGFDHLPSWVNFNAETGMVSGKIGRDGKLNFIATATDSFGATISDNFKINITRNIAQDIVALAPVAEIIGTNSADIIIATANSSDIIIAGAGDDQINYTKDIEWKQSSDGSYYIAWNVYSSDEIAVTGKQRSFDAFDGGEGFDILNLTNQNDVIFLDDAIVSNLGEIAKLSSIEEINGGDGDDVIDLTSLTFSYQDAVLNGGNGNDALWGNDGNDSLNGDDGDDNLQGGKGDDIINGGNGNDIIKAYDGDDKINGAEGFDIMIGGEGKDQFIFTNKFDSIESPSNLSKGDVILDFIINQDKIDLSALDFDSITQGQGSNSLANGLEFYFKDGYTIVDDPNSNFAIKLSGEIQLGVSDFIF